MAIKKEKLLVNIVYSFAVIFYVAIGIFAIVISPQRFESQKFILALLILLSSVPHILIYIINRTKVSYLVIGLVGIAFGSFFLATDVFDANQICMIWGVIDICRGLTEIINVAPTIRKNKKEIIEIVISTGDIVVGVLLILHRADGLQLHLIYLGIAFLVTAAKLVTEYFVEVRRRRRAKRANNN